MAGIVARVDVQKPSRRITKAHRCTPLPSPALLLPTTVAARLLVLPLVVAKGPRETAERMVDLVPELHHAPVLPARAFPPHRRPPRPRGAGPRHHEAHGGAAGHGKVRASRSRPAPPPHEREIPCLRACDTYSVYELFVEVRRRCFALSV